MRQLNMEEFNKEEDFVITSDCFVAGKLKKRGETVTVKGNDKIQLVGSQKAVHPEDWKEIQAAEKAAKAEEGKK